MNGKRSFRYNKKGKDPGNVWIPTLDDGAGKITEHIIFNYSDSINRILETSKEVSKFLIITSKKNNNLIKKLKLI